MTEEKRKRGRPPGSGKKKEWELASKADFKPTTVESYDSDKLASLVIDEHPIYKTSVSVEGIIPIKPEHPYPSNWAELSKVEKLKFLTANKK